VKFGLSGTRTKNAIKWPFFIQNEYCKVHLIDKEQRNSIQLKYAWSIIFIFIGQKHDWLNALFRLFYK
jgi:hypothetical protein